MGRGIIISTKALNRKEDFSMLSLIVSDDNYLELSSNHVTIQMLDQVVAWVLT